MRPKSIDSVPKTSRVISYNIITYYRSDYVSKEGKSPVYLFVNLRNTRVKFNTGVAVPADAWDPQKLLVRKSHPEASDLNLIIRNCKARISDIFVRYRLQHKDITPEQLRNEYRKPSVSIDFFKFLAEAIEERRGILTESTLTQHRAQMNKLKEYRNPISFSELDEDFFINYNRWLKTTKKNSQNTRHNSLKTIRTYLNIAERRGLLEENPLNTMPVKRGHCDRQFLTEEELTQLVNLYRENKLREGCQRVLRHFLFACVSSIRISDLRRIRMEDIFSNNLVLMPYKTKEVNANIIRIPLTRFARELILDECPFRVKGLIFNMLSDQNTRENLKEALKEADIYKKMKFHSSRHTFATIFLRRTKNLAALQKVLGHQKIEETMIYAHILPEDVETEMLAMDTF